MRARACSRCGSLYRLDTHKVRGFRVYHNQLLGGVGERVIDILEMQEMTLHLCRGAGIVILLAIPQIHDAHLFPNEFFQCFPPVKEDVSRAYAICQ